MDPRHGQTIGPGSRPNLRRAVAVVVIAALAAFVAAAALARVLAKREGNTAPAVVLRIGTDSRSTVFDRTDLTVPAGARVTVIFRNNMRSTSMSHNWVLVQPGTGRAVAEAGLSAGAAANFVAPNDPRVIAATPLTPPEQETSVTFPVPPPGTYPYECTFPGHYLVMRGNLRVTPR